VPTLNDLVHEHTDLSAADLDWLHLLVADWQLLADLSFADLVLWVPVRARTSYVAVAQMRPTTGPTVYFDDLVGEWLPRGRRPQVDDALDQGRICRERDPEWREDVPVREETIPVRRAGRVVAVISRHTNLAAARTPSRLELTYLQCAADLAQMVAEGRFPFVGADDGHAGSPRVGDGLVRVDEEGVVTYASPNALSAYRRLGLTADLLGAHLGGTTAALAASEVPVDQSVAGVLSGQAPKQTEVEANGTVVALRAIPLFPGGRRVGAMVLVRDVTELRRRERELLTKDATIREIHHRVKNNLQTVAALLRMQARRLTDPTSREALGEAVRRVSSIALVHETLSLSIDETVDFDLIADRLLAMMADVGPDDQPIAVRREGQFGTLSAEQATPLAMVLNELLQNAVEHGLSGAGGEVTVRADRLAGRLRVVVTDSGKGLPEGFDADQSGSLGLQIVRTLVLGELGGVLELRPVQTPGVPRGVEAVVDLPMP
jgi:two-component sensor histidine kinase